MKFKYTALNQQNHQMTGVLEADSIDTAKDELHKMNLSILVINKISDEAFEKEKEDTNAQQEEAGIKTFLFNAIDPQNQAINGTIDSPDIYNAYKRLIVNYHFKVNLLHEKGADTSDKTKMESEFRKKMIFWQAQMKEEGINVEQIWESIQKEKEMDEVAQNVDIKTIQEVDRFIKDVKTILISKNHHFSPPFMAEIQKTLDKLELIKTSNNVKHVAEVCNEIYDLVSHPDTLNESDSDEKSQYQEILNSIGKETNIIKSQKELEEKADGFEKIKEKFGKILKKISFTKKTIPIASQSNQTMKDIEEEKPSLKKVIKKGVIYLKTTNKILRENRKREAYEAFNQWYSPIKKAHQEKGESFNESGVKEKKEVYLLEEIDSFLGWVLFFYLSYFILINFSLEKNIGLSQDFAIKTLQSPLIINISIFLLMAHFILKIQNRFFRESKWNTFLLLFIGLSGYLLIISNF